MQTNPTQFFDNNPIKINETKKARESIDLLNLDEAFLKNHIIAICQQNTTTPTPFVFSIALPAYRADLGVFTIHNFSVQCYDLPTQPKRTQSPLLGTQSPLLNAQSPLLGTQSLLSDDDFLGTKSSLPGCNMESPLFEHTPIGNRRVAQIDVGMPALGTEIFIAGLGKFSSGQNMTTGRVEYFSVPLM